jgi:hypothetical protein
MTARVAGRVIQGWTPMVSGNVTEVVMGKALRRRGGAEK